MSTLKALQDDFAKGFIDKLSERIESEISSNYMAQAEKLLEEGQKGKFDHVPAAVLSGAVLERHLRQLCQKQTPPIAITFKRGDGREENKMMNILIDDLKKAGVYNETKAKQLRAWADIRNHAAHGEFDNFKREDVELMIKGINHFLADYS